MNCKKVIFRKEECMGNISLGSGSKNGGWKRIACFIVAVTHMETSYAKCVDVLLN